MDNWGRGPWFEPPADAAPEEAGAGGKEVADGEQPTTARRATGGPATALPPLPGAVSRPLSREVDNSGSSGPVAEGMTKETIQHPAGMLGTGDSGTFPRRAMPSRPLRPAGSPDAGAQTQLWGEPGPSGDFGRSASATASRALVPPIPDGGSVDLGGSGGPSDPFGAREQGWNERLAPGGAPPPNGKPRLRGRRGDDSDRRRLLVAWPLLIGLVVLLVACSAIGLLQSGWLNGSGTSVVAHLPGASASATSSATATATANPLPLAARLSVAPASQHIAAPGQMTSCPSGCDLAGQMASNSQAFSVQNPASPIPQSALTGTIVATNTGTSTWAPQGYQFSGTFSGTTYKCAPQDISLPPASGPHNYPCFIAASSPSVIPLGTIHGTVTGSGVNVNYSQPADLTGNGEYEVLYSDCQAALDTVHGQGTTWAQGWIGSQHPPAGWQWARGQALIGFSGDTCPVGTTQPTAFTFTASTTASVQNSTYSPAAVQALAERRLDGLLPGGYQWKDGSRSTCTPSVSSVASNGTVTLSCSDGGVAIYVWSDAQRSALAGKVAGQSKTQALAICNGWKGVRAGSCVVTIQGGDGSMLPQDPKTVAVTVGAP